MKRFFRLVLIGLLLVAGSIAALWLAWALPAPAMFALAAGAMALAAAIAFWRVWYK